jgi:nucleoside-diphosphate-sugar epimerase
LILITGGNGYVGRTLSRLLTDSGKEVISASRKLYETKDYISVVADVSDKTSLEKVFNEFKIETVVHLASMLNTASRESPDWAVRINVMGALHLMELCRDKGVERFVFGSSFNAIGSRPGLEKPVDESEPSLPSEFYGETKRFVEQLGISMSKIYNFEFASARMSIIVGPGEPSPTSAWRTDMFNLLDKGGDIHINFAPDEILPLAHYQDIADSMQLLIQADELEHSIYHLPNESWRASDLSRMLEEMGKDLHVTCGDRALDGIPPFVSFSRIQSEFCYQPVRLQQRLSLFKEVQ